MPWQIYDPANPNENVFFGGSDVVSQRYILTHNGVNSRIQLPNITVNSGDTLRFKIVASGSGSGARVMFSGTESIGDNHFYFIGTTLHLDGGRFSAKVNGIAVQSGVTEVPMDGKVKEFELTSNGSYTVAFLGSNASQFFCDFPIFDFYINDGSVYNYPIDDNSTTVIRNTATVLGPEMFTNPALGIWLDNGDGSYTLNGDGSYQPLGQIALNSNDTYLVEITVDSLVGGTLSAYNQAAHRSLDVGKNVLLITGGSRFDIVRLNGTITATVRDISIKKANGYATPINVTPSMWSLENV